MSDFNSIDVENLRGQIIETFKEFTQNTASAVNKAAARRARKNTLDLEKMFSAEEKNVFNML